MNKKTKPSIIKIAFWTLIFFSVLSIFNIFKSYPYHFNIKGFNYPLENITVNLEFKQKTNANPLICFNDFCSTFEKDNFLNVYSIKYDENTESFFNSKIKNIYLAYPKNENLDKNIKMIDLHNGTKSKYFNNKDILKFKKTNLKITLENSTNEYTALKIPFQTNYKGYLNHFCILFLSLFYNFKIFIIPYFWLFVAFCLYIFNKNNFNFSIKAKNFSLLFTLIIILNIILRINEITYFPLWLDEIYTKTTAITTIKSCFCDPGNPPMFYLLEFLITKVTGISNFSLRLIPLLSGIIFPYAVYLIFKEMDERSSLFMMFFASINLVSIYHSQEARTYSLCITFSVFCIYLLFKYLKNQNTKNLLHYTICSIFTINLHYYMVFFTLYNFIWGNYKLIKSHSKKQILNFILSNIIIFITFVPYLVFTLKNSLSNSFNSWIEKLTPSTFIYIINEYFNNKYIFILITLITIIYLSIILINHFFKKPKLNNYKKELFLYLFFSIVFIILFTSLTSIFIKPILHKRLLLSCYGLLFLFECVIILGITEIKKFKTIKTIIQILIFFLFISITKPMCLREIYVLNDFMNFVEKDSAQYTNEFEIHCITNDSKKYLDNFPSLKQNKKIIWHYVDTNSMNYVKTIIKKDYIKNKGIIYLHDMSSDINQISFLNPNARVYQTNSIRNLKLIYNK